MLQFLHRWCLPFNDETQLPTIAFPSISAQPCGTACYTTPVACCFGGFNQQVSSGMQCHMSVKLLVTYYIIL